MKEITLPTIEELYGDNKLSVIEKMGVKAPLSDFAIVTGAIINDFYVNNKDFSFDNRAGHYLTKSLDECGDVLIAGNEYDDDEYGEPKEVRNNACRMILTYESLFDISMDRLKRNELDIPIVEYGSFPDKAVDRYMQKRLSYLYKNNELYKTGNHYTVSVNGESFDEDFYLESLDEYELEGKKYIRVKSNTDLNGVFYLSNREKYSNGDYVWIKVEPIKWYVDEERKKLISEKLLFSGIPFSMNGDDYDESTIKMYIDKYFSKELFQENKEYSNEELLKELNSLKLTLLNTLDRIDYISSKIKIK